MRGIGLSLFLLSSNVILYGQSSDPSLKVSQLSGLVRLSCIGGTKVVGELNRWSVLSKCPPNYTVTGLQRIDLTGDHNILNLHVNDFICDDSGCKAWCIGSSCNVQARCCTLENGALPMGSP